MIINQLIKFLSGINDLLFEVFMFLCSFWYTSTRVTLRRSDPVKSFFLRGFFAPPNVQLSNLLCVIMLIIKLSTSFHSFIHSAIFIAPLQVLYYSEALPTTAWILYRSFTPKRTGNCR